MLALIHDHPKGGHWASHKARGFYRGRGARDRAGLVVLSSPYDFGTASPLKIVSQACFMVFYLTSKQCFEMKKAYKTHSY